MPGRYPDYTQEQLMELAQGRLPSITIDVAYVPMSADQVASLQRAIPNYLGAFEWGSHGRNGDEPLKQRKLVEMDTDHLEAVLITQSQISPAYRAAILHILKGRYQAGLQTA